MVMTEVSEARPPAGRLTDADDLLVHQTTAPMSRSGSGEPRWFDRFYFNLHDDSGDVLVLAGGGIYPNSQVVDGFVCIGLPGKQINLRFARSLGEHERLATQIGPYSFRVEEALSRWRVALETTEDYGLDVTARGQIEPFLFESISVEKGAGETEFAHFIQPMEYQGSLTLAGVQTPVVGWQGQRDRSWGVRKTRESVLGLHVWFSAHFASGTLAFNYNETRDGALSHCDGAYLKRDNSIDRVVDVQHDVAFDLSLGGRVSSGSFVIKFEGGRTATVAVSGRAAAVQLAGGGYDGKHGADPRGREREFEIWDTTDTDLMSGLAIRVINQCVQFDLDGEIGAGLLELGISRSKSYEYHARRVFER
jgi:hypothetical protein